MERSEPGAQVGDFDPVMHWPVGRPHDPDARFAGGGEVRRVAVEGLRQAFGEQCRDPRSVTGDVLRVQEDLQAGPTRGRRSGRCRTRGLPSRCRDGRRSASSRGRPRPTEVVRLRGRSDARVPVRTRRTAWSCEEGAGSACDWSKAFPLPADHGRLRVRPARSANGNYLPPGITSRPHSSVRAWGRRGVRGHRLASAARTGPSSQAAERPGEVPVQDQQVPDR